MMNQKVKVFAHQSTQTDARGGGCVCLVFVVGLGRVKQLICGFGVFWGCGWVVAEGRVGDEDCVRGGGGGREDWFKNWRRKGGRVCVMGVWVVVFVWVLN